MMGMASLAAVSATSYSYFLYQHYQSLWNQSSAVLIGSQLSELSQLTFQFDQQEVEMPIIVRPHIKPVRVLARNSIQKKAKVGELVWNSNVVSFSGVEKESLKKETWSIEQYVHHWLTKSFVLAAGGTLEEHLPHENETKKVSRALASRSEKINDQSVSIEYPIKPLDIQEVSQTNQFEETSPVSIDQSIHEKQPNQGSETHRIVNAKNYNLSLGEAYVIINKEESTEPLKSKAVAIQTANLKNENSLVHNTDSSLPMHMQSMQKSAQKVEEGSEYSNSQFGYSGHITKAFTGGEYPLDGVSIQIMGTPWIIKTDANGYFHFDGLTVEGVLPVWISKEGYFSRRVDLLKNKPANVELLLNASIDKIVQNQKLNIEPSSGAVFGQLINPQHPNQSMEGFQVELIGHEDQIKPIYFDQSGSPTFKTQSTAQRGDFLWLGLSPGSYTMRISDRAGNIFAHQDFYLNENEGIVKKWSIGELRKVNGYIQNALTQQPVANALVKIDEKGFTTKTDERGYFEFPEQYWDCGHNTFLAVEKNGYYAHQIEYSCNDQSRKNHYYLFSAANIDAMAKEAQLELDPHEGILIGNYKYKKSLRFQLWGPNEIQDQNGLRGRDYYFEKDGILNPERGSTSKNGNYVIFNAPEGPSYLQAFDKKQNVLLFWPIQIKPSHVTVHAR